MRPLVTVCPQVKLRLIEPARGRALLEGGWLKLKKNPPLSDYTINVKTMLNTRQFVENFQGKQKETSRPSRCAIAMRLGVLHFGSRFVGFCNKRQKDKGSMSGIQQDRSAGCKDEDTSRSLEHSTPEVAHECAARYLNNDDAHQREAGDTTQRAEHLLCQAHSHPPNYNYRRASGECKWAGAGDFVPAGIGE